MNGETISTAIKKRREARKIFALNHPTKLFISCLFFADATCLTIIRLTDAGIMPKSPIKEISEASSPYPAGPSILPIAK